MLIAGRCLMKEVVGLECTGFRKFA
jgi:hypothetical protein